MSTPVPITFREHNGTFTGTGKGGRQWRISRTVTGWRLEFRDPGDQVGTNAGVHVSVKAAQEHAAR